MLRIYNPEGKVVREFPLRAMAGSVEWDGKGPSGALIAPGCYLARLEAGLSAFRTETQHEFSELRSMLKLSYAELDTRVTRLECALAEVADRLERLEKSRPT